ncbi:hypothetical protein GJ744_006710 [Endocarpon pusillum]|uniref:Uncharacterized protein n=1 Tax=Endocarpon pusillum TaxID=364733 RepID=A0A8H7E854_9EURO|nr:hypothetical protein GJ744_006710 [Endocarpon pusillum]
MQSYWTGSIKGEASKIEARDRNGRTALIFAARQGNEAVLKWLLDVGAEVNAQGGYYGNALQEGGNEKVVQMLLDAGADVNAQGGCCGNALQAASIRGNEKVVQMLRDAGADINHQRVYIRDGNEKAVQMLLDAGANVHMC